MFYSDHAKDYLMKHILIIDDEWTNRLLYKEFLKSAGYKITLAKDGLEGLELIYTYYPDLIILDMKLPIVTGCEVYRKIKEDPDTKDIPVLIISAYIDPRIIQKECLGSTMDNVYQKPINHQKIKERIDVILNGQMKNVTASRC